MTGCLRVALVANSLGTGGVERQLVTLASHLDRQRFECTLVPLQAEGHLKDELQGLDISLWSPGAGRGFDRAAVSRLRAHMRTARYDAVLAANQYAATMLRLAMDGQAPGKQALRIAAFHSSPAHIGDGWRDRARMWAYRWALRSFDTMVYVSAQQRQEWLARGLAARLPSEVIYNGIDTSRFEHAPERDVRAELGWSRSEYVVGLCAALRPEKRVADLLAAAHLLRQRGLPLRVLIIGDGPERPMLEQQVAALGLGDMVRMVGRQADVRPFIHACDVMTLVSSAEAFSIAVLEAMACGKPMVLTDVGGAKEQIEQGRSGYLVPVAQPAAIADALHTLRQQQGNEFGARARERVQREFSLQRMVDRYARLFEGEGAGRPAAGRATGAVAVAR